MAVFGVVVFVLGAITTTARARAAAARAVA
jgi:hypothetical protein